MNDYLTPRTGSRLAVWADAESSAALPLVAALRANTLLATAARPQVRKGGTIRVGIQGGSLLTA